MSEKILVTYATCTGYTAGVAQTIGETLAHAGALVDVLPMAEVRSLAAYRAVVAGSAIQDKRWLPDALSFVQTRRTELAANPFAAFLVCMTLAMRNGEQYRPHVASFMDPVRALVRPVSEGLFAGGLEVAKVPGLRNRLMFRISVMAGVWTEGDHRDWGAIRAWAAGLPPPFAAS